jgi:hypothetical protein
MYVQQRKMNVLAANHFKCFNSIGCEYRPITASRESFAQRHTKVSVVIGYQQLWL